MPRGRPKGYPKTGGRAKGTPNKNTTLIKDAVIEAARRAGGKEGMVGYLTMVAKEHPPAFTQLIGKVLPTQVVGADDDSPIVITWKKPK